MAACKIQACFRKMLSRKQLLKLKKEKENYEATMEKLEREVCRLTIRTLLIVMAFNFENQLLENQLQVHLEIVLILLLLPIIDH